MNPTLESIRGSLEGVIPATLATCAADGTPNVTYVSQIHFIDGNHVGLSFQFFNKTRENVLANAQVTVFVINPLTAARHRLAMQYLRTESAGAVFESMKARLAGIASHTGMSGVFRLQGADIYRVLDIEHVPGPEQLPPPRRVNLLGALRAASEQLAVCSDQAALFDQALQQLERHFDIKHAMLLLMDDAGQRLYTVASHGYTHSGVGSEIGLGEGVIGVAALHCTALRITHMSTEYAYSRAIRERIAQSAMAHQLECGIPFPGLAEPHSQLAVPLLAGSRRVGVLYVESPDDMRFDYEDEDALSLFARQLGAAILQLQQAEEVTLNDDAPVPVQAPPAAQGTPVLIRHFKANDSIFIGDDYLIKGVAGAIFWTLVQDHMQLQRSEFCNRALRMDPRIRLPDIDDNLEARLILLQRRLAEFGSVVALEKTGRGRFRLHVHRALQLQDI